jgi:hypothetical protein
MRYQEFCFSAFVLGGRVRFALRSGHALDGIARPFGATCGLPHCKKNKGKPFTYQHEWTSARGRLGLADLSLIQGHGPR